MSTALVASKEVWDNTACALCKLLCKEGPPMVVDPDADGRVVVASIEAKLGGSCSTFSSPRSHSASLAAPARRGTCVHAPC